MLDMVGLIISLVFVVFVLFGFLVGLIRGLKKTIIRSIWILVIGVLLIFITTPIVLSILTLDLSGISFLSGILNGASTIEEFIASLITNSIEGVDPQALSSLITIAVSVVAMFISGILYLVFFLVLKFLSLPFYWILNIFIARSKGKPKKRLLGGAVGALLGIILFTFITTPVIGYVNLANKIDAIPVGGLVATPYSASAEGDNEQGGIISKTPVGDVLVAIEDSVVIKVYSAIGLKNLQVAMFNQTSAVKINGETVKINAEIDSIGNVIVHIIPFTDGTIDLSNFEAIASDPEKLEYLSSAITGLLDALYESKIFKTTLSSIMPIIANVVETSVKDALLSDESLPPELTDALLNIISDFCANITTADPAKISSALTSLFDVMSVFPKLTGENGISSLTVEDFAKIGNILDSFIASGLIKEENINAFVPVVIDMVLDGMTEGTDLPQAVIDLLVDVKDSFKEGGIVYANEFQAVGELVIGITGISFNLDEITSEQFKSLGIAVDKAFSHNSKIFTQEVLDDLIVSLLDTTLADMDLAGFENLLDTLKKPFTNHEITSYELEFTAIGEIMDFAMDLDLEAEDIDYPAIGRKLDEILAIGSKIFSYELVDELMVNVLDTALTNVEVDFEGFEDIIELIKEPFINHEVTSYTAEFEALSEVLEFMTDFDAEAEDINYPEIGRTLDNILAKNSKVISQKLINSVVEYFIDVIAEDEQFADYESLFDDIRAGFDKDGIVYETEMVAIEKVLTTLEELDGETIDLVKVGEILDEVVDINAVVIGPDLINSVIGLFIDEMIVDETDPEILSIAETIKNSFTGNDLVYKTELQAIDELIDVFEKSTNTSFNLPNFGKDLDEVLALGSKVITRSLINEFIASSFDDFISNKEIEDAGSLADALSNVKTRLTNPNYYINSYQTEFTAVDKLISIEKVAGNITVTDINKKKFDGNTKTIGQVFDDKIKDSVLLGDSGLYIIDSLIDTLDKHNNGVAGNRDYTEITAIISQNFDALKPTVKCASNKNLNSANTISYVQLADSFAEIHKYLDDAAHKVTDQTKFDPTIANYYETSLNKMQDNLLLNINGTRAVASYLCDEIAEILESNAKAVAYPDVASKIREYKGIILNYKDYLNRPATLANGKLNEKEPYATTGAVEYVTSTDGFKTNISFTTTKPSTSYAYRTNPFTSIATEVSALIP